MIYYGVATLIGIGCAMAFKPVSKALLATAVGVVIWFALAICLGIGPNG